MEDMEGLFELIVVFIAFIGSLVASAKKSKRQRSAKAAHESLAAEKAALAKSRMQAAVQAARPPVQAMSAPSEPSQVIAPTVHTHLTPDCAIHDAPGSLDFASTEGKDPCHEEQLAGMRVIPEEPEAAGTLTFDWSGESMVKAFVMQEVLTRPAQRQAR